MKPWLVPTYRTSIFFSSLISIVCFQFHIFSQITQNHVWVPTFSKYKIVQYHEPSKNKKDTKNRDQIKRVIEITKTIDSKIALISNDCLSCENHQIPRNNVALCSMVYFWAELAKDLEVSFQSGGKSVKRSVSSY